MLVICKETRQKCVSLWLPLARKLYNANNLYSNLPEEVVHITYEKRIHTFAIVKLPLPVNQNFQLYNRKPEPKYS